MKIKVTKKSYDEVLKLPQEKNEKPVKQSAFFRWLLKTLSKGELKAVDFTYKEIDMDKLSKDEPALYLMNHSSFTDLMIASHMLSDRQYHIVTTNDGFIGKSWLMKRIGCIPTKKFIVDMNLIKDMKYTFKTLKSSILMFPEASYSFDGSQTPLPESLGKFIKVMGIPLVIIHTKGAYLRDPLYNNLQKRKAKVTSTVTYRLSAEDIKKLSADEINKILADDFTYDHFRDQKENNITINEPFRADGLHRPLYKCPSCNTEGSMIGKGLSIKCSKCTHETFLQEDGTLYSPKNNLPFRFVTDWYAWERECVAKEIADDSYSMTLPVNILMLADSKNIYDVGEGVLTHNRDGFTLTGCEGKLNYTQKPLASYSLYSDYFWYELGDMISIGDTSYQYYCFPKDQKSAIVAKARLATEEIYKFHKNASAM